MIHFDCLGLADTINVITREIHQHDMLGSVFFRVQQLLAQSFVLCGQV
jgi:hypothetical protein